MILALLLPGVAGAWTHDGHAWAQPVFSVCVIDKGLEVQGGDAVEEADAVFDDWNALARASGVGRFEETSCSYAVLGNITLTLDPDASSVTRVPMFGEETVAVGDCEYEEIVGYEIIVGTGFDWVVDSEIDDESCANAFSLRQALGHHLGHAIGLGHACAEDASCTSDEEASVMWSGVVPCRKGALGTDDEQSYLALYGEEPACDPRLDESVDADTPQEGAGCACAAAPTRGGVGWLAISAALLVGFRRRRSA